LLRARAIETGCFVLAPAQTGTHIQTAGKPRKTYGHSMIVDPWGKVLLDAGTKVGAFVLDIDLEKVAQTRNKLPSLSHDQSYQTPDK
jgi:predicted amidohydrolase